MGCWLLHAGHANARQQTYHKPYSAGCLELGSTDREGQGELEVYCHMLCTLQCTLPFILPLTSIKVQMQYMNQSALQFPVLIAGEDTGTPVL